MSRILLAEKGREMAAALREGLQRAGHDVEHIADGAAALDRILRSPPALTLLDTALPRIGGLRVLEQVRSHSDHTIIVLTARTREADRLRGLDLGADDYVCKPFSPREVVARVRAVLRRSAVPAADATRLWAGDVALDLGRRLVTINERPVELTPIEFGLLATLVRQPGQVFTRAQLLEVVQGTTFEGYERTVDQHIKNLRHKLEPEPGSPRYLLTVFGVGYKFAEA
jgi:two-component system response regulator BaeR